MVLPDTFNEDNNVVLLLNVEYPLTFNVPNIVLLLDKVVKPDTFNDDNNVVSFTNLEYPLIFNVPNIVVLLDKVVNPETFNDDSFLKHLMMIIT